MELAPKQTHITVTTPVINSAEGAESIGVNEFTNIVRNKTTDPIRAMLLLVLGESLSSKSIFCINCFIVYS